jgi:hypothetical protein
MCLKLQPGGGGVVHEVAVHVDGGAAPEERHLVTHQRQALLVPVWGVGEAHVQQQCQAENMCQEGRVKTNYACLRLLCLNSGRRRHSYIHHSIPSHHCTTPAHLCICLSL